MANDNEDGALESNVDVAIIQARQQGVSAAAQRAFPLPLLGFVSTLNGLGGGITLGAGSLPSGVGLTISSGAGTLSINITGISAVATKKSNLNAAGDPAVTDDSGDGYGIGSIWTTATKAFIALDVTVGAAVWLQIG